MARSSILWSVVWVLLVGRPGPAEDWATWRGPRGDGTWKTAPLPQTWTTDSVKRVWTAPVGAGYSGVSVSGGKVYLMDRPEPSKKGENPDGQERVLCFDGTNGKLLWSHRYPAHYGDMDYGNGPRGNVAVHDGLAYTFGAVGHVHCLDALTGKVLWSKDLVKDFAAKRPMWGFAATPVVLEDKVLIHGGAEPDGSLMAFDRRTGKEIWRTISDPAGYATPVVIESPSGPQIVLWTPEHVHGVRPADGKRLWSVPYKVTYGVSIATPIYHEGIVFVTGYWEGSKAIRLGTKPDETKLVWEDNRDLRGLMAAPLYSAGYAYSLDKRFGVTCFELKTGKKVWDDKNRLTPGGRNPQATIVWSGTDGEIVALNSEGELVFGTFRPSGYVERGRVKVLGSTWSNPAFSGKSIFARSDTELVRIDTH